MKNIQKVLIVLIGLSGASALADEPQFETVYEGCDRKLPKAGEKCPKTCELRVIKTDFQGNTNQWEDFRAEVQTSYGHDKDVPGDVVLKTVASDDKLMEGTNSDDSTVKATFNEAKKFESLKNYSLKWKHGDHFHTFACLGLKAKPKAP